MSTYDITNTLDANACWRLQVAQQLAQGAAFEPTELGQRNYLFAGIDISFLFPLLRMVLENNHQTIVD